MNADALRQLFRDVAAGDLSADLAFERLRHLPFEDVGEALLDHHRAVRTGLPEVIYCAGKTVDQVLCIAERMLERSGRVLGTRATGEQLAALRVRFGDAGGPPGATAVPLAAEAGQLWACRWDERSGAFWIRRDPPGPTLGRVAVVSAGTSDLGVVGEAALSLEAMDCEPLVIRDVGVAGIHRLFDALPRIAKADVVIAVAGMEGALPSVLGGLVSQPLIAVPTSVGYGASFGGLAALLAMLNSCSPGVTVVNIDNGFGAAAAALAICRRIAAQRQDTRG